MLIRVAFIDQIPTNITGDESWNITNLFRIIFGKDVTIFTFMEDGSIPAIVYYPLAFFIKTLGVENSIILLRLHIVIYSILSLIIFYFILKNETSRIIALIFTILLSSNYVFLNFSRTGWINMTGVFSTLLLTLILIKAQKEKNNWLYLISGVVAGISLYLYNYGKIFTFFLTIFLVLSFFKKDNFNINYLKKISLFLVTLSLVFLPLLLAITKDNGEAFFRRINGSFAFSEKGNVSEKEKKDLLIHQVEYTFRGLILLDGKIMSEGIENRRYLPLYTPPVNIIIKILFILSFFYLLIYKRKYVLWWVAFAAVLLPQITADLPPNFSRGLFYIPFIYFVISVFLQDLINYFKKGSKNISFLLISIMIASIIVVYHDISIYFDWMQGKEIYMYRQPAISYEELSKWQNYQIDIIREGNFPIVNQQWYEIRNLLN